MALGRRSEINAPKKEGPIIGFSFHLHYNAPAHQSALVKDFFAKKNLTTLELSTHSPDLVPAHFYLFPGQKSAMKIRRFRGASSIIKKCDGRAEKIFTRWLPGMFETPLQLDTGRKCIVGQEDCFEGNVL